jgi:hypothetical protein
VAQGWNCSIPNADACRVLDHKLRSTAKALQSLSQKHIGSIRIALAIANEVIFKLDQARDHCSLSAEELQLRSQLKMKGLGLASLAHTIAIQRSRLTFLEEGDTNTSEGPDNATRG